MSKLLKCVAAIIIVFVMETLVFAGSTDSIKVNNVSKIPNSENLSLQGWLADGTTIKAIDKTTDDYLEIDISTGAKSVIIPGSRFQGMAWYGVVSDGSKILFKKPDDNSLYVMNSDGTSVKKLWAEDSMNVDISPDGLTVLLIARNSQHKSKLTGYPLMTDVVTIKVADGAIEKRFTMLTGIDSDGDPKGPSDINISPDGMKIAIRGGIVNADGTGFVKVQGLFPVMWSDDSQIIISEAGGVFKNDGTRLFKKSWDSVDIASDGSFLFYLKVARDAKETEYVGSKLYVTNNDGNGEKLLFDITDTYKVVANSVMLSSDNKYIAISTDKGIYICNIDY